MCKEVQRVDFANGHFEAQGKYLKGRKPYDQTSLVTLVMGVGVYVLII